MELDSVRDIMATLTDLKSESKTKKSEVAFYEEPTRDAAVWSPPTPAENRWVVVTRRKEKTMIMMMVMMRRMRERERMMRNYKLKIRMIG